MLHFREACVCPKPKWAERIGKKIPAAFEVRMLLYRLSACLGLFSNRNRHTLLQLRVRTVLPRAVCMESHHSASASLQTSIVAAFRLSIGRTISITKFTELDLAYQSDWRFTIGNVGRYQPLHREKYRSVATTRIRA